jgi:hypothetical protein
VKEKGGGGAVTAFTSKIFPPKGYTIAMVMIAEGMDTPIVIPANNPRYLFIIKKNYKRKIL